MWGLGVHDLDLGHLVLSNHCQAEGSMRDPGAARDPKAELSRDSALVLPAVPYARMKNLIKLGLVLPDSHSRTILFACQEAPS
eukprot:gene6129-biopygen13522